jgi:hypothetical protein
MTSANGTSRRVVGLPPGQRTGRNEGLLRPKQQESVNG